MQDSVTNPSPLRPVAKLSPKPHVAERLPISTLDWRALIPLIVQSNSALARYDGTLQGMVNPNVLLSPLRTQEAVLSSKIEGTVATLQDVLRFEASDDSSGGPEKREDIQEILNYRRAMSLAVSSLKDSSISLGLIRSIHGVLLAGVRGQDKSPGKFRETQNHIGRKNCAIEEARFIPPEPVFVKDLLDNLETYIGSDDVDPLVQMAVIHGQFEVIHPFMDGNGRVGRILIPLFLYMKGLLSAPVFYLSSYLDTNVEAYNDALLGITKDGDWEGWIRFFLQAVTTQAKSNMSTVHDVFNLYEDMKRRVADATHSGFAIRVLDAMFDQPIFNTSQFVSDADISKQNAGRILRQLTDAGILQVIREGSGQKPTVYCFWELLQLADFA